MAPNLHICLDARLRSGVAGGTQQVILGLAEAFSELDGPERYSFLVYREGSEWITPHLAGPCAPLYAKSAAPPVVGPRGALAKRLWQYFFLNYSHLLGKRTLRFARSDGTAEDAGCGLIQFNHQEAFLTELPSIYLPHDLQHEHYPEYFAPRAIFSRRQKYKAFSERSKAVVIMTNEGKLDLIHHLSLAEERIARIPWSSSLERMPIPAPGQVGNTLTRYGLRPGYFLFPAHTHRHKNHLSLLEALKQLRDREGLEPTLVCTGGQTAFFPEIEARVAELGLTGQVRFLGYVSQEELQILFLKARALVFPSFFEGFGLPVVDAFFCGTPVLCSNASCIPEVAGDAAFYFDPRQPEQIADTLARAIREPEALSQIARLGRARAGAFSLHQTALRFRALYRKIQGAALSEDDRALIEQMFRPVDS